MKVKVVESTMVVPSEETPQLALWLSNLDLVGYQNHTPLLFYYPAVKPGREEVFSPDQLRVALARALVLFYPLAGRLGPDKAGRQQINCNGEGALFVVARADCAGEDLFGNYEPSADVRRMLVPPVPSSNPLGIFQVTFLKCGGVVLGTGLHHATTDGTGYFHFIQTWTRLARGLDVSEASPWSFSHDRTPLRGRSPPHVDFDHLFYSSLHLTGAPRPYLTRVYPLSPKHVANLKSQCAPGVSTFKAVTAHLWRCMCIARGLAPGSATRLRVTTNVRHRVRPPLQPHFWGNAIVRDLVTANVADLLAQPLGLVADTIRKMLADIDDAYVRSLIDYVELESKKGRIEASPGRLMPESDMWVVSWLGMNIYDADFGLGTPRLMMPAEMFGPGTAYVTENADRDDGITVLFALEPQFVCGFQDVFYATLGHKITGPFAARL